ncbi:MAG: hypothetical protein ABIG69_15770 [Bacteroidota bacterium]
MRRAKILLMLLLFYLIVISCNDNIVEQRNTQNVNIPDTNFKIKIIDAGFDLNKDGEISFSEAEKIDSLNVAQPDPTKWYPKIKEITGIGAFANLEYFNCYGDYIKGEIDLSKNINLTYLNIGLNHVTNLNINNLAKLRELDIKFNNLRSLDLSTNISLRKLDISFNTLTDIDITHNIDLEGFSCVGNSFTSIDFSKNVHLKKITISGASINFNSLDISNSRELEDLSLSYIKLPILDISKNKQLRNLGLGFIDNLRKICVWELPLPDSIAVTLQNITATIVVCE